MDTDTVSKVAEMLAVSPQTTRRWSKQFAEHLSSDANPPKGAERRFTDDDVRVLAYARDRLKLGLSVAAVLLEIPTATLPTLSRVSRVSSDDRSLLPPNLIGESLFENLAASIEQSGQTQQTVADALTAVAKVGTDNADIRTQVADLAVQVRELREVVGGLTVELAELREKRGRWWPFGA